MTALLRAASSSRRQVVLGGGLLAVAGAAAAMTPRRRQAFLLSAKLGDMAPDRLGPWSDSGSEALILPESQAVESVYDKLLTRSYLASGLPSVMLLIAYGAAQSGLMQVHRPEVCYQSAGFQIDGDRPAQVPLRDGRALPAKRFTARREQRIEQVLYWTRIADSFPTSLFAQRVVMAEQGMRGLLPDGLLVRLSTLSGDADLSQRVLLGFAQELVEADGAARRSFFAARV